MSSKARKPLTVNTVFSTAMRFLRMEGNRTLKNIDTTNLTEVVAALVRKQRVTISGDFIKHPMDRARADALWHTLVKPTSVAAMDVDRVLFK